VGTQSQASLSMTSAHFSCDGGVFVGVLGWGRGCKPEILHEVSSQVKNRGIPAICEGGCFSLAVFVLFYTLTSAIQPLMG
jgi:hypothetical protein